jgi:unsaturated rhamnogalacturonyl hydrolase
MRLLFVVMGLAVSPVTALQGQQAPPRVAAPWSVRTVESVIRRSPIVHERWDYVAGVMLRAVWEVGMRTGEQRYFDYVKTNMDRLIEADGTIRTYQMADFNLDQINQGRLLFPLYARTRDERYRKAAMTLREQLRKQPRTKEGGFWHKQIYPYQMWLDGIYMASPFLVQYGRTFNEPAAIDEVVKQILLIARHTRDPKTGLFYHGWDETRTQLWADSTTGLSKNFWGRAVGWYAMALVDVLEFIPAQHPGREPVQQILQDLARAVAAVQDPVTGLWWQILDQPSRAGNYLETSASSMFVYALAKGARLGHLGPQYRRIALRGYEGLLRQKAKVDSTGLVTLEGIVQVGGLGGAQKRDGSFAYYLSEPVVADDYKGVGPFVMASLELGR